MTYGLRVHEFRKFATLPLLIRDESEVALDIHAAETSDLTLLSTHGWRPASIPGRSHAIPRPTAPTSGLRRPNSWSPRTCTSNRRAAGSATAAFATWRAESQSSRRILAWRVSIRWGTVCWPSRLWTEAVAGVKEIDGSYERHCRAAREIAHEYFDSEQGLDTGCSKRWASPKWRTRCRVACRSQ